MTEVSKQAKEMSAENGLDEEVNQAYIDNVGAKYAKAEDAEEAYSGDFDSDEDFVEQLLEDTGDMSKDLPSYIHIDWEATARDIMMDYFEVGGHYFRNL